MLAHPESPTDVVRSFPPEEILAQPLFQPIAGLLGFTQLNIKTGTSSLFPCKLTWPPPNQEVHEGLSHQASPLKMAGFLLTMPTNRDGGTQFASKHTPPHPKPNHPPSKAPQRLRLAELSAGLLHASQLLAELVHGRRHGLA